MVVNEHAVVNPRTEKYASARGIKAQRPQLFMRFSPLHSAAALESQLILD
jgi:hypothetical protein